PVNAALLVIDVQVGIIDHFPVCNKDQVLANINDLLTKTRAAHVPVIYLRHDGGKGHSLEAHTAGWPIHQRVAPVEGEPVVENCRISVVVAVISQRPSTRGMVCACFHVASATAELNRR
ncbi:MAG TPA: isochorismatase family protein, partial [Blastocatellia bacterium]|nr:isochorismatase family protein [Blastocatellia bacterium]